MALSIYWKILKGKEMKLLSAVCPSREEEEIITTTHLLEMENALRTHATPVLSIYTYFYTKYFNNITCKKEGREGIDRTRANPSLH